MCKLYVLPCEFGRLTPNSITYDDDILLSACRLYSELHDSLLTSSPYDEVIIGVNALSVSNIDSTSESYWCEPNKFKCGDFGAFDVDTLDPMRCTCVSTPCGSNLKESMLALLQDKSVARSRVIYNAFAYHAVSVCESLEFDYKVMAFVSGNVCTRMEYVNKNCRFSDIVKIC